MSTSGAATYMAWGNTTDPEARAALGKALTASYVAGTKIRVEGSDMVTFYVDVDTKSTLTTIYAKMQTSVDGSIWVDVPAFTTPTAVGIAPNQEMESEVLPRTIKFIIPTATADQHFQATYQGRTNFIRILLKGDAAVVASVVKARASV